MTSALAPLVVLALGGASCRPGALCTTWLEQTSDVPTAAELARPAIGHIVDNGLSRAPRSWSGEYADESRQGTLGPLAVEFNVWNYKGQLLSDGHDARIFEPSCSARTVPITMPEGFASVGLLAGSSPGLYFIKTGHASGQTLAVRVVTTP